MPTRPWTATLLGVAVLGMVALGGLGVWWQAQGGRWYDVATPSMGRAMPVGTLVLTRPVAAAAVRVGDVVTFRSPGNGRVYTHRVIDRDPHGALLTQGDISSVPDAWSITDRELVGRVVWHARGLGWAVRAVPHLVVGCALVWLVTTRLRPRRRSMSRLLGVSAVAALTGWWLRPWVGVVRMGQTPPPDGQDGVLMQVVSTGLLPIRVAEVGGPASSTLTDGQVATLHLTAGHPRGLYELTGGLDLSWWGWALLVACCLTPLWWTLGVGLPRAEPQEAPT